MYVFLLQRIVNQEKGKSWGTTKGYVKEATEEYIFFLKKCVFIFQIFNCISGKHTHNLISLASTHIMRLMMEIFQILGVCLQRILFFKISEVVKLNPCQTSMHYTAVCSTTNLSKPNCISLGTQSQQVLVVLYL